MHRRYLVAEQRPWRKASYRQDSRCSLHVIYSLFPLAAASLRFASISAALARNASSIPGNNDIITQLTVGFSLSLCLRRFTLSTDLGEACEICLCLIGLALFMKLVETLSPAADDGDWNQPSNIALSSPSPLSPPYQRWRQINNYEWVSHGK